MKRILSTALSLSLALTLAAPMASAATPQVTLSEQYLFAGSNGSWYTEESYNVSPVVIDLDGDGSLEVLNASYSLVVMDAATGTVEWRINAGHDRSSAYDDFNNVQNGQVFTDFEVADIDADGSLEIIIAYGNGSISVLNNQGYFESGWPQQPTTSSIRSLALADLDGDGKTEVIVGAGVASAVSVWAYHSNGSLVSGWPQLDPSQQAGSNYEVKTGNAYSYGVFGDGICTGDIDGDGLPEVIVPTDTAYIDAYNGDGSLVTASPIYEGRSWGKIALWEDYDQEIACVNEGWGFSITGGETRAELYRSELGHAGSIYTDVDGDGTSEIVVTALMTDRTNHSNTNVVRLQDTRYMTVYILNQDRTRYVNAAKGFDWTTPPVDLGGPLKSSDPVSIAAGVFSEPVASDLDGDGYQEILFNSYNGKLHCFSLDGTEHGSWPFTLPKSNGTVYEYASAPTCVDLNGDGQKEVIFASWTDNASSTNTGVDGALYVLSSDGQLLASCNLHPGYSTYEGVVYNQNGVMAPPVVQDVDGDGKYEILLNTTYYALCAYEVTVAGGTTTTPTDPQPAANTAYARTQTVTVDGTPVTFQTYALKDANGFETNYVKVRDVASVLNGSAAQFNVSWDGAVNLQTATPYAPDGSEMSTPFTGDRAYQNATAETRVNGTAAPLEAILLQDDAGNGYTYYKLRDLGDALGFVVDWSAEAGITVSTQ